MAIGFGKTEKKKRDHCRPRKGFGEKPEFEQPQKNLEENKLNN